ncbi:MAG TPA: septal ring lytic transglycosylase RlpA family protein [Rectinemataceae bacterium]|nr:septal ring lytic transglycosylase RlpA family protein [Rectinemataceae bacterium]
MSGRSSFRPTRRSRRGTLGRALALAAALVAVGGAAAQSAGWRGGDPGGAPPTAPTAPAAPADSGSFSGTASWYGPEFAGRVTSSGEIYDPNKLTAAHRSLPFGTLVLVRNLDNGSSVVVRIDDRGPFARGRVIDLSKAAARLIGMIPTGTARVSCSIIPPEEALAWKGGGMDGRPPPPDTGSTGAAAGGFAYGSPGGASVTGGVEHVRIQVASYASEANAGDTVTRLRNSGLSPSIEKVQGHYRVVFPDLQPAEARRIRLLLNDMGYRLLLVTSWTDPVR